MLFESRMKASLLVLISVINLVLAAPRAATNDVESLAKAAAPAAKCRRASTLGAHETSPLEIDAEKKIHSSLPVQLMPTTTETTHEDLSASAYNLEPGLVGVILKATFFYTCGLTGSHSRRFVWEASHRPGQDLLLTGVQNIEEFVHLEANVPRPGAFRAVFTDVWDVSYASLCCQYFAAGHFEGTVTRTGISMDLITMSGEVGKRPYVSEDCRVPGTAPRVRPGAACQMTYVHVEPA